eukprot:scaffold38471_cov15-Tisochrysis_lutea.AAC.1
MGHQVVQILVLKLVPVCLGRQESYHSLFLLQGPSVSSYIYGSEEKSIAITYNGILYIKVQIIKSETVLLPCFAQAYVNTLAHGSSHEAAAQVRLAAVALKEEDRRLRMRARALLRQTAAGSNLES